MIASVSTDTRAVHLEETELGCVVFALRTVERVCGRVYALPPGTLWAVGGLLPETAFWIEEFIGDLDKDGIQSPSVPRVLAELDLRGKINYPARLP